MRELLSEILRPTELSDLVQTADIVARFERMVADSSIMNMLFYGKPGVGKTSAARLMLSLIDACVFEINGSTKTGIDQVRKDVEEFCSTLGVYGKPRICFIDECEYLSASAQAGLRGVIEKAKHVRFLLTANEIKKLHPALKSRCIPICFDPSPLDAEKIIERLLPRYSLKLADAGLQIDDKTLRDVLFTEFPDLRRVANRLEFEASPMQSASVLNGTTAGSTGTYIALPSGSHSPSDEWSISH